MMVAVPPSSASSCPYARVLINARSLQRQPMGPVRSGAQRAWMKSEAEIMPGTDAESLSHSGADARP